MAPFRPQIILLLVVPFLTSVQSGKILSELKKCGDLECESLMIRVQASQDFTGPDCRYLSFKIGEEVLVYYKLSGKREDLWAGSKGKEFGYFPKEVVKIEDVYITEEVEVATKETDFICLDGDEYIFENEDSILQHSNGEADYPHPDKETVGPDPIMPEGELQKHTSTSSRKEQGISSASANGQLETESKESQAILPDDFEEIFGKSETNKNNEDAAFQQDESRWTVSDIGRWFGIGSKAEKEALKLVTETSQEGLFRSRKIAVRDENSLKEAETEEPGWFDRRFTDFLDFGEKNSMPDVFDTHQEDLGIGEDSDRQTLLAQINPVTEKQGKKASESQGAKSSWFPLDLDNVLNFGQSEQGKMAVKEEQREEKQEETDSSSIERQSLDFEETDSYIGTEKTKETGKSVTSEIHRNGESELLSDSGDLGNESPATGWFSGNLHNLLNLRVAASEVVFPSTVEVNDKHQAAEHSSVDQGSSVESQVMKNIEDEEMSKEAQSSRDQSGWYENIYSTFISFNRLVSSAQTGEQYLVAKATETSTVDQSTSSVSSFQLTDSTNVKHVTGERYKKDKQPQSLLSLSHFTDLLSISGVTSKVEEYIRGKQENQCFKEETPQFESDEGLLQDVIKTKEKLQALLLNNRELLHHKENNAVLSEETMPLSTSKLQTKWEYGKTLIKGNKFVTDDYSTLSSPCAKSQFEHAEQSEEHLIQICPNALEEHSGSSEGQEVFEEEITSNSGDTLLNEYHRIFLNSDGKITEVSLESGKISTASYNDDENVCKKEGRQEDTSKNSLIDDKLKCDGNGINEDGNSNNVQVTEPLSNVQSDESSSKVHLSDHLQQSDFLEGYKEVVTDIKTTVRSEKYSTDESLESLQCSVLREKFSEISNSREDGLNETIGNEDFIWFYQKDLNHSQNLSRHSLKLSGNKLEKIKPTTEYADAVKQDYEAKENEPTIHEPKSMDMFQTRKSLYSDVLVSNKAGCTANDNKLQVDAQDNDLFIPHSSMPSQQGHIAEELSVHENFLITDATETQSIDKAALAKENILTGQILQKQVSKSHSTYIVSYVEDFKLQEEPKQLAVNQDPGKGKKETGLHELSSKTELQTSDDGTENSNSNKRERFQKEEVMPKENRNQKDPVIPSDLDKQQQLVSLSHLEDTENTKENENSMIYPYDPQKDLTIKLTDISEAKKIFQDSSVKLVDPIHQAFIEQREYLAQEPLNFVGNSKGGNLASHLDLVSSSHIDMQTVITVYEGHSPRQPMPASQNEKESLNDQLPCLTSEHDLAFDTQHINRGRDETSVQKDEVPPTENHNHLEEPDNSAMVACDERNIIYKDKQGRQASLNSSGHTSLQDKGNVDNMFSRTSGFFLEVHEANEKLDDGGKQPVTGTNSGAAEMHYENTEALQVGSNLIDHGVQEPVITPFASGIASAEEELQNMPEQIPAKQDKAADQPKNNLQDVSSESEFLISEDMIANKDSSLFIERVKKEEALGKESQDHRDILASLDSDLQQFKSLSYEHIEKIIKREHDIVYPQPKEDIAVKLVDISESKEIFQDTSVTSEEPGQLAFTKDREPLSQEYPTRNSEVSHVDLISSSDIDVQMILRCHEEHNPSQPISLTDRQEESVHEHLAFPLSESKMAFDNEFISKIREESYVEKHEIPFSKHHNQPKESDNSEKADWEEQNRIYTEKQERIPSKNRMNVKSLPSQETVSSMFVRTSWVPGDFFTRNIDDDTNKCSENRNPTCELNEKLEYDRKQQPVEDIKSDVTEIHYDDTKHEEDLPAGNGLDGHVLQEYTITSPVSTYSNPKEEELQVQKEPEWIPASKNQAEVQRGINLQDVSSETEFLISDDVLVDKSSSNFREHLKNEKGNQNLRPILILASSGSDIPQPASLSYRDDTENTIKRESNILSPCYPREERVKLMGIYELKEDFQECSATSAEPSQQAFTEQRAQLFQEQPSMVVNLETGNVPEPLHLVSSDDPEVQRTLTFHEGHNTGQMSPPTDRQEESMHESFVILASANAFDKEQIGQIKEKTYAEKNEVSPAEHHSQSKEFDSFEKAGDREEGNRIDTETQERLESQGTDQKRSSPAKGMISSIFSRVPTFLGDLFNKDTNSRLEYKIIDHGSNANGANDRTGKINSESSTVQKSELIENVFEKETSLQSIKTTGHLAISSDLKILMQKPETGQVGTQETSVTAEKDKKGEKSSFTMTDSVLQQNKEKLIHEIDPVMLRTFSELQELHQNITRVQTAQLKSVCEANRMKLLWYEQYLENTDGGVSTSTCAESSRKDKHNNAAAHKSEIWNENWLQEKMRWLQKLQNLLSIVRTQCAAQDARVNAEPGIAGNVESSNPDPEKIHYANPELRKGHRAEASILTALHAEEKEEYLSASDSQEDAKESLSETPAHHSDHSPYHEDELTFWMLQYLNTPEICSYVKCALTAVAALFKKLMEALPEDLKPGPDLHGFPWEMVFCAVIVGLFTALLFICRTCQSIKSRLYVGRERQLAAKVAELVEDKCSILEKLSLCKQQYEELELSLDEANHLKESSRTSCLEETSEKLNRSNALLQNDLKKLEKELEEEKSMRLQQDNMLAEIQKRIDSLESEAKAIKSQAEEARTTLKVFQINKGRLETSLQDAIEEHSHLQESNQQLSHEAEGWDERLSELSEQTKMFDSSKKDLENALNNKESQIKSLTECLLKMKDWSSELGEDNDNEDNSWEVEMRSETENGEHLEVLQKRTVKKLIYAAKLNASLKTLESERNQIYSKLSDEVKTKEELADRIKHLQNEQSSLHSETSHFDSEVQKLQQKLKVMTEMYQENEMKLHRKLTVEEKDRLQKEEKLSKVDEKIIHAAEELNSYRTRTKDLEEELEKTIRSYQSQITSHEKKAHDNWLTARTAERHLNDVRKENAHTRQKLTEAEFKLDLLEKDPYALDFPSGAFGRENSPYGLSPLGRPSSETRAFLSPPTLLEGPLRLSPGLPGGGEQALRGAGNHTAYPAANERVELSCDRVSDHQQARSDTGSLSPPWERERKMNVPISDGQPLLENSLGYESSGNEPKKNFGGLLNASDRYLPPGIEAAGPGFVPSPHPPIRSPLLPMDPRGPFLRRAPPFPPFPHPGMYGPREYFSTRDFAGIPRPPLGMRNPFPPWPLPNFPPQRAGFFPPQSLPESRNEPLSELAHPSSAPSAEKQQET